MKQKKGDNYIYVERNDIYNYAYNCINTTSPKNLKKNLKITFLDENGQDNGGLTRYIYYFFIINEFKSIIIYYFNNIILIIINVIIIFHLI